LDRCHRARLCWTTRTASATGRGCGHPKALTIVQAKREYAATFFRIEGERIVRTRWQEGFIGKSNVQALVVGRGPPFDTPEYAAFAHLRLPEELPLTIRVNRVYGSGFLGQNERAAAVWQVSENGRRAEIEIGTLRLGAIL
jgi:hypothetical protein